MTTEMQLEVFWREIVWPLASCGAQTIKQSLVMTKRKGEIVSVCVRLSCPEIWDIWNIPMEGSNGAQ